jgi:glycosyltransferase involved in cell wall biosynthesis
MISVLTPTYNRAGLLENLYNSLVLQTNKSFEWLIVDDGSEDNTEAVVKAFKKEGKFAIRYLRKENGGKHTALNFGIKNISSELTFIVDSDDILTSDAIEVILKYQDKYKENRKICGYSFLRGYEDGKVNGKLFRCDEMIASYIDSRINADDTYSDKAEVFLTSCLKEYTFPEYPDERFLGEDLVWIRMALKYEMVHINKVIYIGNYLDCGLTQNRRKNNIQSPNGCVERAKEFMRPQLKLKYRIKGAVLYITYGVFAGKNVMILFNESPMKLITIACIPCGLALSGIWKKKFKI